MYQTLYLIFKTSLINYLDDGHDRNIADKHGFRYIAQIWL